MRWSLALVVGLTALAGAPAAAFAATIDFEGITPGTTVNAQFSGQGVTFNGSTVYDYGAGFAHSGTRAIENCRGVEFCGSPPIRADFTAGQASVGVWVGYHDSGATTGPRNIRLTAFDDGGGIVGTDEVTVPLGTPANSHLEVTSPGTTIRALEVKPGDGADSNDIVVDDVEFSTEGPPPPCGAGGTPAITLLNPTNGTVLQNNQVLLRGVANGNGAPITAATVTSQGSTTRTANAFPTPVDADGGVFAINMNGLLQPGHQFLTITATNCAGTSTSNEREVVHSPLPPTTEFRQLAPVEVVQTVQSPYNPVPLVAGGANGTKRTMARVHLTVEGGASQVSGVSGRISATRPDGSRPDGPLTVDSLNTITVPASQTLDGARSKLGGSLNFELPPEWVTEGRLHVGLEQLRIEGAQTIFPCKDCGIFVPTADTVSFHRVPPVRIWLIGVPFTPPGGGPPVSPRQFDFDMLSSWLRRAYPTAEVQVTQSALPLSAEPPGFEDNDDDGVDEDRDGFLCDDVNSRLSQFAATMTGLPAQTRYYGLVADTGGNFMRGCANIGGRFGSGPTGSNARGWDFDGAYGDWYGGHEIGHMFDRRHPGSGCGESDDDDSFPYLGGAMGNFIADNVGIDMGDSGVTPALPMALYDWRAGWTDVMTYCDKEWLSSYTYNGILKNLCGKDKLNCPNHANLTKAEAKGGGPRLAVDGTLNLERGRVALEPMSALGGLTLTKRPKRSAYAIVLRDAGGGVVGRYPFKPKEIADLPAGQELATISEVVPFSAAAKSIEITAGKRRLARQRVSAHPPTVRLSSPKGKRLRKPVKLRWSVRDADGGRLTSTLQYAADGKRFVTVAAGLGKRSFRVDPRALGGGKRARFRVVVTDGVLTGTDSSRPLRVKVKKPTVSIAAPEAGAQLAEGQSVQLVASVSDLQDQRLGRKVVWSSDLQGKLGRGSVLTTQLQPGEHTLTATVSNQGGKTGRATVRVVVEATPPTIDAQLIP